MQHQGFFLWPLWVQAGSLNKSCGRFVVGFQRPGAGEAAGKDGPTGSRASSVGPLALGIGGLRSLGRKSQNSTVWRALGGLNNFPFRGLRV